MQAGPSPNMLTPNADQPPERFVYGQYEQGMGGQSVAGLYEQGQAELYEQGMGGEAVSGPHQQGMGGQVQVPRPHQQDMVVQPVQVQVPPQQQMMQGDGFGSQVTIKQIVNEAEAFELLCACEVQNKYSMRSNVGGDFYISETSGCLERICCGPNRSLTFNVHKGPTEHFPIAYRLHKSMHLQGCCFCRPQMTVHSDDGISLGAGNQRFLGSISDPCRLCTIDNEISGPSSSMKYVLTGTCLSVGVCCPCGDAEFDILNTETRQKVGMMQKKANGAEEFCFQANKFVLDFPTDSTPDDKALLIGATMLVDIEYFERRKQ